MRNAYVHSAESLQAFMGPISDNPDLVSGVEVASGRKIGGVSTFLKMIKRTGALAVGANTQAHSITGLIKMYRLWGVALRDSAGNDSVLLANADVNVTAVNNLVSDNTNIIINIGTVWTGAGSILSDALIFMEYTKS